MNVERRIRKLEGKQPDRKVEYYRVIVNDGVSEEVAICQHFGGRSPPENAFIILRTIVGSSRSADGDCPVKPEAAAQACGGGVRASEEVL